MAINYPQRYDDDFLNTVKKLIDHVNEYGKTIQDLVAEGQLTEEQYAKLITTINSMVKSGEITKSDLHPELQSLVTDIGGKVDKSIFDLEMQKKREKTVKIEPEDFSDDALSLVTGNGTVNIESVPQDYSVDLDKLVPQLRKSLSIELRNRFTNGNLESGTYGFGVMGSSSTLDAQNNTLSIQGTGNESYVRAFKDVPSIDGTYSTYIYITGLFKVDSSNCEKITYEVRGDEGGSVQFELKNPKPGESYRISEKLLFPNELRGRLRLAFGHHYANASIASGKVMEVKNLMTFDLTTDLGAGNEVSKEFLDTYIDEYMPEGEYSNVFKSHTTAETISALKKDFLSRTPRKLWDEETTEKTEEINTESARTLFLNVKSVSDNTIKVSDGQHDLMITNLQNGSNTKKIATHGFWQIDVADKEKVYVANNSSQSNRIVDVEYALDDLPRTPYKNKAGTPKKMNGLEAIKTYSANVHDYKHGVIYDTSATVSKWNILRTSEDFGDTFTERYTFSDTINRVRAMNNGNVLVALSNGEIYLSTDNMTTFNLVLDVSPQYIHKSFGFTVYDNIVLLAPYNTIPSGSPGKDVYMSTDFGENFNKIFSLWDYPLEKQGQAHIHVAQYDPYEDLIWVGNGDSVDTWMVHYSSDMGETWHQVCEFGEFENKPTTIIPLENCVLFGSDARLVGMMRYVRPEGGTVIGNRMYFDHPLIVTEEWGKEKETEVPISSEPVIDFENSVAYFSWVCVPSSHEGRVGDALSHGEIYMSDGFEIKLAYKDELQYSENVYGIYGDATDGKIIAKASDSLFQTKIFDITNAWSK